MHESIDVVVELDERTVAGDLGDLPLDHVADLEVCLDLVPRVGAELLHAERDTLAVCVHIENDVDFVALLDHLGWVVDLAGPGHVGDVNHTVDAFFEFDECTVGSEVANLARTRAPTG